MTVYDCDYDLPERAWDSLERAINLILEEWGYEKSDEAARVAHSIGGLHPSARRSSSRTVSRTPPRSIWQRPLPL